MFKRSIVVLSILILNVNYSFAWLSKELLVQTTEGDVIGRYMKSNTGRSIRAFMGIPYAEPPIGDLRFKSPQKKKDWNSSRLSTQKEPPKCPQMNYLDLTYQGQEDCLYLNVYAPESRHYQKDFKYPVMVWFHGGSLFSGHGGISEYGPDYILDADVIFVSGNYRLSVLGFLSTEDDAMPGNYGLKDQVAILKWVNENIEAFGGNKNSITIFGGSAGGVSVNYHMISPISQNLFHRAISQSGTLQTIWGDPDSPGEARKRAIAVAEYFNCTDLDNSKMIANCLRKISAEELANTIINLFADVLEYSTPYLPVMENLTPSNQDPFITIDSFTYNQRAKEIPWLVGINSEEGAMITANLFFDDGTIKLYRNDKIPIYSGYNHLNESEQEEITSAIRGFYLNNEDMSYKLVDNITNLFTDSGGYFGMFDVLETRFKNNSYDNTYVYLYSHKGAASYTEVFGRENFYGTCHMDDLLSLFPLYESSHFYKSIPTDFDRALHKIMPHLWANFATTGNPNIGHINPLIHSNQFWPAATKFPLNYMRIGNDNGNSRKLLEAKVDLYPERVEFWRKLKEKYPIVKWKL